MLISLRLPDNLLAEIDAEAKIEQRSRNWIMLRRLGWKAVQESPRDKPNDCVVVERPDSRTYCVRSEVEPEDVRYIVDIKPRQSHNPKTCRIYGCLMCKMEKER